MTSKIFEEHLRKLDRQFRFEKRQVAFILENCSAHPLVSQTLLTSQSFFFTTKQINITTDGCWCYQKFDYFVKVTTYSQENQVLGFENRF